MVKGGKLDVIIKKIVNSFTIFCYYLSHHHIFPLRVLEMWDLGLPN